MRISVIIPALNEEHVIAETIRQLREQSAGFIKEVIVSDGGSRDNTVEIAAAEGATVVKSPQKGRAGQMNYGAAQATGEAFYFLHADSHPPAQFDRQILDRLEKGNDAGCFRLGFDSSHYLLRFYAWFTRFDLNAFRFGDQSLFISASFFTEIGGFRNDHMLMEDNEIVRRIKNSGSGSFTIIPEKIVTSSRKYRENGVLKLQLIFTLIYTLYHLGVSQGKLVELYKKWVR